MKVITLSLFLICFSLSCREERMSRQFEEKGVVVDKKYVAPYDDEIITYNDQTSSFDYSTIHHDAKYSLTFRCTLKARFRLS